MSSRRIQAMAGLIAQVTHISYLASQNSSMGTNSSHDPMRDIFALCCDYNNQFKNPPKGIYKKEENAG